MDALFPADGAYFELLDRFVKSEPEDTADPYMHGMLAALGIARAGRSRRPTGSANCSTQPHIPDGRWPRTSRAIFDGQDKALWWQDPPVGRARQD